MPPSETLRRYRGSPFGSPNVLGISEVPDRKGGNLGGAIAKSDMHLLGEIISLPNFHPFLTPSFALPINNF